MRRKQGVLIPLELAILEVAIELRKGGVGEFHGFMIAKGVKEREGARLLTAYGTMYKALDRMEKAGLLSSRWEDPLVAAQANRPRRRLCQVTTAGETALAKVRAGVKERHQSEQLKPGRATS